MKFSIVTPSYNMLTYLRKAVASVADQEGVELQHIIMDGRSTDGTVEWLKSQNDLIWNSEPDNGMYDAVNKGLENANGDIFAYLNCDEQYLPGTLQFVDNYFVQHPEVDIIFGDALLVRPDGSLISYRKGYSPRWFYILSSHLYVLSCTMFFRKIFDQGFKFDTHLRDVGDGDFVVRVLRNGFKARHLSRYFATFTWAGQNMSLGENARIEALQLRESAPAWVRWLRTPLNALRLIEKTFSGAYYQKLPFSYEIYTGNSNKSRRVITAEKATWRWPKK